MGDAERYDALYRETALPWEIGGPQPALARVLDEGVPGRTVLDVGCGPGDLAIALARRGYEVTGVDVSRVAIDRARAKAAAAGVDVRFEVQDATALALPWGPFDAIFDSGLLHSLDRNGARVDRYLAQLPDLAATGAVLHVLAVSAAGGQTFGLTEEALRAAFPAPAWTGTRVDPIEVAAESGGERQSLPGFLLRTVRTSARTAPRSAPRPGTGG